MKLQVGLLIFALCIHAPFGGHALHADNHAQLSLPDGGTCFFGGTRASIPVEVNGQQDANVRLSWSLTVSGGVVARREVAMALQANRRSRHVLELDLPETREGLAISGRLEMTLTDHQGTMLATKTLPLHIFDPDPFVQRKQWLKNLNLHVYDSEGGTATAFEKAEIPFKRISNLAAFDTIGKGILIIGEGLSLKSSRGLVESLVKAAHAGVPALVLAPIDGQLQLPGIGTATASEGALPSRLSFQDSAIIARFDKRLDVERWAGHDSVLRYFQVGAYRNQPEVAISTESGWPWMDLELKGGKSIYFCGFGVIRDWEASPVPRYLLSAILEKIMKGSEE